MNMHKANALTGYGCMYARLELLANDEHGAAAVVWAVEEVAAVPTN